jgi:hypothetical protein
VGEERQRVPLDVDGQAAGGLNVRQAADPDQPGGRGWLGHGRSSSVNREAGGTVTSQTVAIPESASPDASKPLVKVYPE